MCVTVTGSITTSGVSCTEKEMPMRNPSTAADDAVRIRPPFILTCRLQLYPLTHLEDGSPPMSPDALFLVKQMKDADHESESES